YPKHQIPPTFIAHRSLLVAQDVPQPSDDVQLYFASLASAAERAATSAACSSILAGHTSESDEFADVSIWLGQGAYGKGHELAVLKKLGLEPLVADGRVSPVELSIPRMIPVTIDAANLELDAFAAKLAELKDLHCFSLRPASGSDVIYSLVGKNSSGWGGLLGIGIWSDD
ncbi:hypothetical protein B0H10DRAFT_2070350, partial [Mycena sp. CBHHK59/15]